MSVGVVVLSYNRPRWLAEALASIQGAAQIVIADDGSDFDIGAVAVEHGADLVRNAAASVSDRMNVPRQGQLFNRALALVNQEYVTYLCDDDVFSPGWLPAIERCFADNEEAHMVRGEWHILGTNDPVQIPGWCITTGNFAHRTSCATDEGAWWSETETAVQDAPFLHSYFRVHGMSSDSCQVPHTGALAGWRREHQYNLSRYTNGLRFAPSAEGVLSAGFLEPA